MALPLQQEQRFYSHRAYQFHEERTVHDVERRCYLQNHRVDRAPNARDGPRDPSEPIDERAYRKLPAQDSKSSASTQASVVSAGFSSK
jgi:hypothetical protein